MTDFLRHTTGPRDRWDSLANEYYGDPDRFEPILKANPGLGNVPALPSGIEVLIPILEESSAASAPVSPWRL